MRRRPARPTRSARAAAVGLSGVFVGLGLSGALPPAVLPVLGREAGLAPAAQSLVVSAVFAGLFAGVALAAVAAAVWAPGRLLAAGAMLQAAGVLVVGFAGSAAAAVAGAVLLGVGFGVTELSATAVVRGLEEVTGRGLTGQTGLVALTAALTPITLGLLVATDHWRLLFAGAAVLQVLSAASVLPAGRLPAPTSDTRWRQALRPGRPHLAAAAYVGAETVVVAWVALIAGTSLHLSVGGRVAATAGFWIAVALGRTVASRALAAGLPARRLLPGALATALLALSVAAATGGPVRVVVVLVGLVCLGPVYPLILATAPGTTDPRVLAPLIAAGSLGGTLVTAAGAAAFTAAGLAGVLLLAAAMLGIALASVRTGNRPPPVHSG